MKTREGPPLELLLRRLAETAEVFLREPRPVQSGGVDLEAVLNDLLLDLGGAKPDPFPAELAVHLQADEERARTALILAWLLHDGYFRKTPGRFADGAIALFQELPERFAGVVKAGRFVTEPDRREELARLSLDRLGLRPAGETEEQAADRLVSLDSIERASVIREARAAEKRAQEIREAMARKAAAEAAATYGRE
ncbi:MAG TPA: hypothetical protein PLP29_07290 [Candidatus Ozemobacteraceae bacterium]|nr:hypothetical protein [Candidatus Ozemobacteraceae bacterium]